MYRQQICWLYIIILLATICGNLADVPGPAKVTSITVSIVYLTDDTGEYIDTVNSTLSFIKPVSNNIDDYRIYISEDDIGSGRAYLGEMPHVGSSVVVYSFSNISTKIYTNDNVYIVIYANNSEGPQEIPASASMYPSLDPPTASITSMQWVDTNLVSGVVEGTVAWISPSSNDVISQSIMSISLYRAKSADGLNKVRVGFEIICTSGVCESETSYLSSFTYGDPNSASFPGFTHILVYTKNKGGLQSVPVSLEIIDNILNEFCVVPAAPNSFTIINPSPGALVPDGSTVVVKCIQDNHIHTVFSGRCDSKQTFYCRLDNQGYEIRPLEDHIPSCVLNYRKPTYYHYYLSISNISESITGGAEFPPPGLQVNVMTSDTHEVADFVNCVDATASIKYTPSPYTILKQNELQTLRLRHDSPTMNKGSFKLKLYVGGVYMSTTPLSYSITSHELKLAIEEHPKVTLVDVTARAISDRILACSDKSDSGTCSNSDKKCLLDTDCDGDIDCEGDGWPDYNTFDTCKDSCSDPLPQYNSATSCIDTCSDPLETFQSSDSCFSSCSNPSHTQKETCDIQGGEIWTTRTWTTRTWTTRTWTVPEHFQEPPLNGLFGMDWNITFAYDHGNIATMEIEDLRNEKCNLSECDTFDGPIDKSVFRHFGVGSISGINSLIGSVVSGSDISLGTCMDMCISNYASLGCIYISYLESLGAGQAAQCAMYTIHGGSSCAEFPEMHNAEECSSTCSIPSYNDDQIQCEEYGGAWTIRTWTSRELDQGNTYNGYNTYRYYPFTHYLIDIVETRHGSFSPKTEIVNGIGNFEGIVLSDVGNGYILQIYSRILAISKETEPFSVNGGNAALLYVDIPPGAATGGIAINPQPKLSVVDVGNNKITLSVKRGCTISIGANPSGGKLSPEESLTVDIIDGNIYFAKLYIDVAGGGYELVFTANFDLPNPVLKIVDYTVGIGPPNKMKLLSEPGEEVSGFPFKSQPAVSLHDFAGNKLKNEFNQYVRAVILNNPSGATLYRSEMQSIVIRHDMSCPKLSLTTPVSLKNLGWTSSFNFQCVSRNTARIWGSATSPPQVSTWSQILELPEGSYNGLDNQIDISMAVQSFDGGVSGRLVSVTESTTIALIPSFFSKIDGFFVGRTIQFTSGAGIDQSAIIADYIGDSGEITFDVALNDPVDNTTKFTILPWVETLHINNNNGVVSFNPIQNARIDRKMSVEFYYELSDSNTYCVCNRYLGKPSQLWLCPPAGIKAPGGSVDFFDNTSTGDSSPTLSAKSVGIKWPNENDQCESRSDCFAKARSECDKFWACGGFFQKGVPSSSEIGEIFFIAMGVTPNHCDGPNTSVGYETYFKGGNSGRSENYDIVLDNHTQHWWHFDETYGSALDAVISSCSDSTKTTSVTCISSCSNNMYVTQISCDEVGEIWTNRVWTVRNSINLTDIPSGSLKHTISNFAISGVPGWQGGIDIGMGNSTPGSPLTAGGHSSTITPVPQSELQSQASSWSHRIWFELIWTTRTWNSATISSPAHCTDPTKTIEDLCVSGCSDDAVKNITFEGISSGYTPGFYTAVASTSSGTGTGATFDVAIDSTGTITTCNIKDGGSGYQKTLELALSPSIIGHGQGGAITVTEVEGTSESYCLSTCSDNSITIAAECVDSCSDKIYKTKSSCEENGAFTYEAFISLSKPIWLDGGAATTYGCSDSSKTNMETCVSICSDDTKTSPKTCIPSCSSTFYTTQYSCETNGRVWTDRTWTIRTWTFQNSGTGSETAEATILHSLSDDGVGWKFSITDEGKLAFDAFPVPASTSLSLITSTVQAKCEDICANIVPHPSNGNSCSNISGCTYSQYLASFTGTLDSGGINQAVLPNAAHDSNNYYTGRTIKFLTGAGSDQSVIILSYVASTRTITFDDLSSQVNAITTFEITEVHATCVQTNTSANCAGVVDDGIGNKCYSEGACRYVHEINGFDYHDTVIDESLGNVGFAAKCTLSGRTVSLSGNIQCLGNDTKCWITSGTPFAKLPKWCYPQVNILGATATVCGSSSCVPITVDISTDGILMIGAVRATIVGNVYNLNLADISFQGIKMVSNTNDTSATNSLQKSIPNVVAHDYNLKLGEEPFNYNSWYHVAVSYSGVAATLNNLKLYWTEIKQGIPFEAQLLCSGSLLVDFDPAITNNLIIGGTPNGNKEFPGVMDEVRISNKMRSPIEMLSYYTGLPVLPIPLSSGSFRLKFTYGALSDGVPDTRETGLISYKATSENVRDELRLLSNIREVQVERYDNVLYEGTVVRAPPGSRFPLDFSGTQAVVTRSWNVTFITELGEIEDIIPTFKYDGIMADGSMTGGSDTRYLPCMDCEYFSSSYDVRRMQSEMIPLGLRQMETTEKVTGCVDAITCMNKEFGLYSDLTVKVNAGEAHFENLAIDKIGKRYIIRLELYIFVTGVGFVPDTRYKDVTIDTAPFDVQLGDPTDLNLVRRVSEAWAGGQQPFSVQPAIALMDAGGNTISTNSHSNIILTMIHDPTGASKLTGTTSISLEHGFANFTDIALSRSGRGYVFRYHLEGSNLSVDEMFDVDPSAEVLTISKDARACDRYGWSVAIDSMKTTPGAPGENVVIVGAPGVEKSQYEVQRVMTKGTANVFRREKQSFGTSVPHQNEVQQISTHVTSNSIIELSIKSGGSGYTPNSYTSVGSTTNGAGNGATFDVVVNGDGEIASCLISFGGNGYILEDEIILDTSIIGSGTGADIIVASSSAKSTVGGSFKLSWKPTLDITLGPTRPISTNASPEQIEAFIMDDLRGIFPLKVEEVSHNLLTMEKTWTIEFLSSNSSYVGCFTKANTGTVVKEHRCMFPFYYKEVRYDHCPLLKIDGVKKPWCSVDEFYVGNWGECDCNLISDVPEFIIDKSQLTGTNANAVIETTIPSNILGGTFKLKMRSGPVDNPKITTSRNLPWNATPLEVKTAIEEDLYSADFYGNPHAISIYNIFRSENTGIHPNKSNRDCRTVPSKIPGTVCTGELFPATPQGGFEWVFEYNIEEANYDIPQIEIDNSGMSGHDKIAWSRTLHNGEAPIAGFFKLGFKTEGPTVLIPFDATAKQLKSALEALDNIDEVIVEREGPYFGYQYIWSVTFSISRSLSEYGFFIDEVGDIISLRATTEGFLSGTNARVDIDHVYGDDSHPVYRKSRMGSPGQSAGAVFVLTPESSETWEQTYKVVANDGDSFDFFGFDVALDNEYMVVGAPGKEDFGSIEEQDIICNADGGWFSLSFMGDITKRIPYNADHTAVLTHLENLYSIAGLSVDKFSSVCDKNGTRHRVKFVGHRYGNVPSLQVAEFSSLVLTTGTASVVVETISHGTSKVHGNSYVHGFQSGAAYVFHRVNDENDESLKYAWQQQAKLLPIIPEYPTIMSFGFSVEITGNFVFVSAPHEDQERGAIYVFIRKNEEYQGYCTSNDVQTEDMCISSCSNQEHITQESCVTGNEVWTSRIWIAPATRILHWSFENAYGTKVNDRSANARKTPNQSIIGGASHPSPGITGTLLANEETLVSNLTGLASSGSVNTIEIPESIASIMDISYIGQKIKLDHNSGSQTRTIIAYDKDTYIITFSPDGTIVETGITFSLLAEDFYKGKTISFTSGTGSGQTSTVTSYNSETRMVTFDSLSGKPPDSTTFYEIYNDNIVTGTLLGGTYYAAILPEGVSSVDDFYTSRTIYFISGQGKGQSAFITAYNGTYRKIEFNNLRSPVDNTTKFRISADINVAGSVMSGTAISAVLSASDVAKWVDNGVCGAMQLETFGSHRKSTALYFGQRESNKSENGRDQMIVGANNGGNVGSSSFSLSIWLKVGVDGINGTPTNNSGYATLISKKDESLSMNGYELRLNNPGSVEFRIKASSGPEGVVTFGENLMDEYWHFIVVTIDRINGYIYPFIDSTPLSPVSWEGIGSVDNSAFFEVAGRQSGGKYFKGYLDDIRIYLGMLTQREISFMRNACLHPSSTEHYVRFQRLTVFSGSPKDRIGNDISVFHTPDDTTIACGAAGVGSQGAVQLFNLNKKATRFDVGQLITPYDGQDRGGFGLSLSLNQNTLVVGAPFETNPEDPKMLQMGAVYVYRRECFKCPFIQAQKLIASDGTHGDRFGISVAIDSNTLLVSAQAGYPATQLRSQRMVQTITTHASESPNNVISGSFIIAWRYSTHTSNNNMCYPGTDIPCHDFEMEYACNKCPGNREYKKMATPRLEHDIDYKLMKVALQNLGTGKLSVSRSMADSQGGYTWRITFLEQTDWIPKFDAFAYLAGKGTGIFVKEEISFLPKARGGVYVHTRKSFKNNFIGHAVAQPKVLQNADMYGHDIALHAEAAVVGAPNRDSHIPGINSGSSFIYNMQFLNIAFDTTTSATSESDSFTKINLTRCSPFCNRSTAMCENSGGMPWKEACFRLGTLGESCYQTCLSSGGVINSQVTSDYNIIPKLLGFEVPKGDTLGVYECYVSGSKYARPIDVTGSGSNISRKDSWYDPSCQLACPCNFPDAKEEVVYNDSKDSLTWRQASQFCLELDDIHGHLNLCLGDAICPDGPNIAASGGVCSDETKKTPISCIGTCSDTIIKQQSECVGTCSDVTKTTSNTCVSTCSNPEKLNETDCDQNKNPAEIWTNRYWTTRVWSPRIWSTRDTAVNRIPGIAWAAIGDKENAWIGVGSDNLCKRYRDTPNATTPPSNDVMNSWTRREVYCCGSTYPGYNYGQSIRYYTGDKVSNIVLDSTIIARSFPDARKGTALGELCLVEDKRTDNCKWSGKLHEKSTDNLLSSGHRAHVSMRGHYDYQGKNDYSPDSQLLTFGATDVRKSFEIAITNDDLYEAPDEFFNIRLNLKGFVPIFGGQFWHVATIVDDSDGMAGTVGYSQKMSATDSPVITSSMSASPPPLDADARKYDGYGYAVAISGGHSFVTSPFHSSGGKLYIKRLISGKWMETQQISQNRCEAFEFKVIHFDVFGNSDICTDAFDYQDHHTNPREHCNSVCSSSNLCNFFFLPEYTTSCCISETEFTDLGDPRYASSATLLSPSVNTNTIHWWHMDETGGTIADAIPGATNLPLGNTLANYSENTILSENGGTSTALGTSIDISGGTLFLPNEVVAGVSNDGHLQTSGPVSQANLQGVDGAFTYEAFVKVNNVGKFGAPSNDLNMIFYHDVIPSGTNEGFKLYIDQVGNLIFQAGTVPIVEKNTSRKCNEVKPDDTDPETCIDAGDCLYTAVIPGITGNLEFGGTTRAILGSDASDVDGVYIGMTFKVTSGLGIGQERTITNYKGGNTKQVYFYTLDTPIAKGDSFEIMGINNEIAIASEVVSSVATHATLPSDASSQNNYYVGRKMIITGGAGFPLWTEPIQTYDGTTKIVTFPALQHAALDRTSEIQIPDLPPSCTASSTLTGLKVSLLPPPVDGAIQFIDFTSWYHVAVTYDGKEPNDNLEKNDNLKLYWTKLVDGVASPAKLVAIGSLTSDLSSVSDSNNLIIGGEAYHDLQGQLDELCRFVARENNESCSFVNYARKTSGIWTCFKELKNIQTTSCVDNAGTMIPCSSGNENNSHCSYNSAIEDYLDSTGLQISYRNELSGFIDEVRFSSKALGARELLVAQLPPYLGKVYKCRDGRSALFGMSIAADNSNKVPTVVVGAPGVSAAKVYVYDVTGFSTEDEGYRNGIYNGKWKIQGRLETKDAFHRSHYFADEHAVGIHGDYVIVGAKGLEAAFLYRRDISTKQWSLSQKLRSSDYQELNILTKTFLFRPNFGASVAIFENTLVVGSPQQIYRMLDKNIIHQSPPPLQGTGAVYVFSANVTTTEQTSIGFCRGRPTGLCTGGVDMGDGTPWCETVLGCSFLNGFCVGTPKECEIDEMNNNYDLCTSQAGCRFDPVINYKFGEHSRLTASDASQLDNFGSNIAFDGDALAIAAFTSGSNPSCTWDFESGNLRGWQRSGTAFNNQPTFGDNPMFRSVYVKNFAEKFSSRIIYDIESIQGHLSPYEEAHHFITFAGYKTSFTNNYFFNNRAIITNSTLASCEKSCYESGRDSDDECIGFQRLLDQKEKFQDCYIIKSSFTGSGIEDKQVELVIATSMETHIKKPYIERFYSETAYNERITTVKSNLRGNYWVGSYEDRNKPSDPKGQHQGDTPVGAMWSPPFLINGSEISFLLGGGCSDHSIYVELVVNYRRVLKNTGWCSEKMRRVKWDVQRYIGKSGIIRIVDNAVDTWGHINVDDFKFSWRIGGRASDKSDAKGAETPKAGSVYMFRRHSPSDALDRCDCVCPVASDKLCICGMDRWRCPFSQEIRLTASDKQPGDLFGKSLSLSDTKNILTVGASHTAATDQSNNIINHNENSLTKLRDVGSVYIFTRTVSERDGNGVLLRYPAWAQHDSHYMSSYSATFDYSTISPQKFEAVVLSQLFAYGYMEAANLLQDSITLPNYPYLNAVGTEKVKIQPFEKISDGHFGWSVAVDDYNLIVGAPSESIYSLASGSSYFYSIEMAAEGLFSSQQTVTTENTINGTGKVGVQVFRLGDLSSELHFHYATSDGSAIGITSEQFDKCSLMPKPSRIGKECGDFKHTSGVAVFYPGMSSIKIFISIVDDFCQEPTSETFTLQLSLIGGPSLTSQYFRSIIRIDDNDTGYRIC